jgi:hypothetical protein
MIIVRYQVFNLEPFGFIEKEKTFQDNEVSEALLFTNKLYFDPLSEVIKFKIKKEGAICQD